MTKFILVKHGHTDYESVQNRGFKGQGLDFASLTEKKIKQVEDISYDERFIGSNKLISSPCTNAMQTAAIISEKHNLSINVELDLHDFIPDLKFNYTDRKLYADNYQAARQQMKDDKKYHNIQHESIYDIEIRTLNVLKQYLIYNKVIVVTHDPVMFSLTNRKYRPCDIAELEYDEKQIEKMLIR